MFDRLKQAFSPNRSNSVREKPEPRSAIVGKWGENLAVQWLTKQGYRIIGQNVRPNRRDEIDIIVRKDEFLIFVEVKTRRQEEFGTPRRSIKERERHALNRAAAAYLRKAGFPDLYYRFDVIEVIGEPESGTPLIRHIESAFPFEKRFCFPV